jgi:hypothetical protein
MRTVLRVLLAAWPLLLAGCGQPSGMLDCSGHGTARGSHEEINSGQLEFKHAVAFALGSGYTVIFTDDATLAELMRASPSPEYEAALAAAMLDRLLVGFRFDAQGQLLEHLTLGNSTSSGTDGSDRGAMTADTDGCARGDVRRKYHGNAYFAVPLAHPEKRGAALAVEYGDATNAAMPASPDDDMLARWRAAYARLTDLHPVTAVQALGFSAPAAAVLAADPRTAAVLERVRTQCANPARATLNEYGEVAGPSLSHDGFVFQSTVVAETAQDGAYLANCYVMHRNDEALEQCWPLKQDCSKVPAYVPTPP